MPSRRRTRRGGGGIEQWSREETIQLLAALDVFLRTKHHYGKIHKDEIIQHLSVSTVGSQHSARSIEYKLRRISQKWGLASGDQNFQLLLERGTSTLPQLEDDWRRDIENMRIALELEFQNSPRQLRRLPRSSRVTPTPEKGFPGTPRIKVEPAEIPSSARHQSARSSTVRRDCIANSFSQSPTPQATVVVSALERTSRSVRISASRETMSETQDTLETNANTGDQSVAENIRYSDTIQDESSLGEEEQDGDEHPRFNHMAKPILDYNRPESIKQFCERPILSGGQELLGDLWRDNIYFKDRLDALNNEQKIREQEERCQQANDAGRLLGDNAQLQRRVELQTTLHIAEVSARPPHAIEDFQIAFAELQTRCGGISRENNFQYPQNAYMLSTNSQDTRRLLQAAFAGELSESGPSVALRQLRSRVPIEHAVHCLIGVSMQEWVLKPPLRCLALLETPLLHHYRNSIQALGGAKALQAIEFSSHRSLLGNDSFRERFVLVAAKRFAGRMLDVLGPFLIQDTQERRAGIHEKLQSAYQLALQIKLLAVCCKDSFDTIWPRPGSTMPRLWVVTNKQRVTEHLPRVGMDERCTINLPLLPGIRRYGWSGEFGSLVDYSNFEADQRTGLGDPRIVCKPVVVLYE